MALSLETHHLVQCPVTSCGSWHSAGPSYKKHLRSAHAEYAYLEPTTSMPTNAELYLLGELDETTSVESDSEARHSTLVKIATNTC